MLDLIRNAIFLENLVAKGMSYCHCFYTDRYHVLAKPIGWTKDSVQFQISQIIENGTATYILRIIGDKEKEKEIFNLLDEKIRVENGKINFSCLGKKKKLDGIEFDIGVYFWTTCSSKIALEMFNKELERLNHEVHSLEELFNVR